MPARPTTTTSADTANSDFSAAPTISQTSSSVAPGRMAVKRFPGILVHQPLQGQRRSARLESEQECRDGALELPYSPRRRGVRAWRFPVVAGHRVFRRRMLRPQGGRQRIETVLSVLLGVNGIHAFQGDVHRAIHRCAGTRQHSRDAKRMILVQREAHVARAMRDDDRVAEPITQRFGDVGAQHRVVSYPRRAGPAPTRACGLRAKRKCSK